MKVFSHLLIASMVAVGLPAGLLAQDAASGPAIEPGTIEALNKMGAYLRSLKSFQVKAEITQEDVLTDGQKVTFAKVADIVARMPDRLFAKVSGDRSDRLWFYNGKTFTLYAQRAGYYATVNAPPTLGEFAQVAWDKYSIEIPLEDLFLWGSSRVDTSQITAGTDIGPGAVEGLTCEHYAFRQPGLDWQIWIQLGDHPLPRKLVLTTLTDDARPQHTEVLSWNLAPSYDEGTFTFDPPDDAHKIVFASKNEGSGSGSN